MEKNYKFNYNTLDNYINEYKKCKNRTDWELTILRDNFRKRIINTIQKHTKYTITINETTWEVKINWNNIENMFYTIPTWYNMDKKARIYNHIRKAMDEAKNYWIYSEIFDEITES